MTVLVAHNTPPAIRGHLKRWFIEPRPNVFIGTLNVRTIRKVLDFVLRNSPPDFGLLVISSAPNCQGYVIEHIGPEGQSGRREVDFSGIPLIAEQWIEPENCPF
ncbi:CRISPR-associated protein Cas2 [Haloferula luteola]|uniref:CRISPR-associated protein Cas2 n=1 Tax=Haloferula luteola TaxID=595692 RepID=A0A840UYU2_9BACT|nr:type I-E CRISPR-associated endoribonuclease Cas2e [Haloferula luteola]MBB5350952.1 CRISPR-associated protein Cas2 [Haloferula luteola]